MTAPALTIERQRARLLSAFSAAARELDAIDRATMAGAFRGGRWITPPIADTPQRREALAAFETAHAALVAFEKAHPRS